MVYSYNGTLLTKEEAWTVDPDNDLNEPHGVWSKGSQKENNTHGIILFI